MKFRKMHGLGNDFVIFDARTENLVLTPEDMALIADRHWGVGCDTLVVLDEAEKADIAAYFFNADGSESATCGNASRCVADLIMNEMEQESCTIQVPDRILECRRKGDLLIEVDMGKPQDIADLPLEKENVSKPVFVNMGNPHCVFFVDDLDKVDVRAIGAHFETHEQFPDRANVEFVQVIDKTHLRQVTWERGVGITEACGSGACAVTTAAVTRALVDRTLEIELDGGILHMEWRESDDHILMAGPVAYVFKGELSV